MPFNRLPARDPRTVARDIPAVLDVLFPRLTGGLVNTLNATMFSFPGISPIPNEIKRRFYTASVDSRRKAERLLLGIENRALSVSHGSKTVAE